MEKKLEKLRKLLSQYNSEYQSAMKDREFSPTLIPPLKSLLVVVRDLTHILED